MDKRIIDISEHAAGLSVRLSQLVIKSGEKETTVPLEEVGALVVSHPGIHYTHAVMAGLCANEASFIFCDEKHLPAGMLLPLSSHFVQGERFAKQASISLPFKKNLWRQIVSTKIRAQGKALLALGKDDCGLLNMAKKVVSGDPANVEGHAARRYWPALFGADFRRSPGDPNGINSLLNYGYAVLRAIIARAVCAVGLHPSLGIHHHNRYDPFCLADDLMEPFRPVVDMAVYGIIARLDEPPAMNRENKQLLLSSITARRYLFMKEARLIFDIAARTAASLAAVYLGRKRKLSLPDAWIHETEEERTVEL
jgi:CRISPR-associated protein Cas1